MSSFNEALRELVDVTLHTAHVWIEEIRHHAERKTRAREDFNWMKHRQHM